ncbi:hypothetical protein PUL39_030440 [Pseudomonas aeruginosa]|uniref:hypothetical protein n=1 Tax=Pseudomonas aeruginosa TaxID=287 RepID=UPI0023B0EF1F|nr:hypothetical protein [Pseudomonas aeruginosa]MDE8660765.1 hypothetical protein [Pseudomonas aeruginosa]
MTFSVLTASKSEVDVDHPFSAFAPMSSLHRVELLQDLPTIHLANVCYVAVTGGSEVVDGV